ncbi:MAG: autotransporter-associated beta strand repeat-containing protein, partial [Prevotella sp.]
RTEVANGGTVTSSLNDKHVLVCENADINVSIEEGAKPHVLTFNVPTWVQGSAPSECSSKSYKITYDTYTCTVGGGGLAGEARLVKQGDGILVLPKADFTHTGNTDIWAGTVNFDGTMRNSSVWLNRFAELNSTGGEFRSIRMDYDSRLRPGGENGISAITVDSLMLGFGSRVVFDINTDNVTSDNFVSKYLSIETKDWKYGPEYLAPVFEFVVAGTAGLAEGKYLLGTFEKIEGDIADIKLLGLDNKKKCALELDGTSLYLVVYGLRDATSVVWTGSQSSIWDVATTENFVSEDEQASINFVNGDKVLFGEDAAVKSVTLNTEIEADSIIFDNTSAYTLKGEGAITGNTVLVKRGTGTTTISTTNTFAGGTRISGGVLSVSALANDINATGNLGGVTTTADKLVIENGASLRNTAAVTLGSPMKMETEAGGVIDAFYDFTANRSISGTMLTKKGSGALILKTNNTMLNKLVLVAGNVTNSGCTYPAKQVELQGGTLYESAGTSYPIEVAQGKTATWSLTNNATYTNKITGAGTLNIYCPLVDGGSWMATRTQVACNFSAFEGTIIPQVPSKDYRFTLNNSGSMPLGTMNIAEGIEVQNSAKTFHIGKVTGSGSLGNVCSFSQSGVSGVNTWKVGNETNFSWSGKVTGTGTKFVKVGTGRMAVSGIWDNTGSVTVSEGELAISLGKSVGTGPLVVEAGGKLSGVTSTNTLTNSSYTIKGGLQVGLFSTATTGKMDFGDKNVNISETGTLYVVKSANSNPRIVGINTLTMNGTISVILADGYEPKDGDTITLWEATTVEGTPQFDLPELALGLKWDTSAVMNGVLKIYSDPTAIGVISGDNAGQINDIYNLKGQLVRKNATSVDGLPRGVYLQNGKKIVVK